MVDRLSILTEYLDRVLQYIDIKEEHRPGNPDFPTWREQMRADLAKLKPRKEKLPDPISLDMAAGKWAGITGGDIARWAALFPGVNLENELRKAAVWILGHPTRAKERWTPFLIRWLRRALGDLERKHTQTSKWDEVGAHDDGR